MSVVIHILLHLLLSLLHPLPGEQQLLWQHVDDMVQVHCFREAHLHIAVSQLGQVFPIELDFSVFVNLLDVDEFIELFIKVNLRLPLMVLLSLFILNLG